ncbi:MAG: hypothetical protein WC655_07880 [Candidatus Hydrogenedentales bacterium]|jgi:hypothetical protein
MSTPPRKPTKLAALRLKYHGRFDAVMMLVYVLIVYVWALRAHPLGRDYAILADPTGSIPGVSGHLVSACVDAFGSFAAGYHLVNIALLYACMVCMYRFVNLAIGGPWWLGTLTATLFMSNPVHTESVLNLTGMVDILPTLAALLFLVSYASNAAKPSPVSLVLSLTFFILAVALFPENGALVIVAIAYEWIVVPTERRSLGRVALFAVLSTIGFGLHGAALLESVSALPGRLASLYFLFYPIGYLPETVAFFRSNPWAQWLAAAVAVLLLALTCRAARRPAILFGLLAMAAVRIAPDQRAIDPVHLVGGGQLLTANVFYSLALVALFYRIMAHPKWRFPMVSLTTLLAAAFFALQISANVDWHRAGKEVRAFQSAVEKEASLSPEAPVGVLPNWRYVGWAPMCLSESIAHDTPFGKAYSHVSMLELNAPERGAYNVDLTRISSTLLKVSLQTKHAEGLAYADDIDQDEGFLCTMLTDIPPTDGTTTMELNIESQGSPIPKSILPVEMPLSSSGEESRSEPEAHTGN